MDRIVRCGPEHEIWNMHMTVNFRALMVRYHDIAILHVVAIRYGSQKWIETSGSVNASQGSEIGKR